MFENKAQNINISYKRDTNLEPENSEVVANPDNKTPQKESWLSFAFSILLILVFVFLFRYFVAKPFIVNGASMDPSFASWDYLIIDVFTYKFLHEPERGDVVVFKAPISNKKYFIKRVIALPGEKIAIKDGKVKIFNQKNPEGFDLNEPYVSEKNKSYRNLEMELKDGEYFVMGDNRAGSYDSRFWGALKRESITGRAFIRLYPFDELDWLPAQYKFEN